MVGLRLRDHRGCRQRGDDQDKDKDKDKDSRSTTAGAGAGGSHLGPENSFFHSDTFIVNLPQHQHALFVPYCCLEPSEPFLTSFVPVALVTSPSWQMLATCKRGNDF